MPDQRPCLECGYEFTPCRASQLFHHADCRKAFHNRRMARGAQMYDLVMLWRFDRPDSAAAQRSAEPTSSEAHVLLSRLASMFRQDDFLRKHVRSYFKINELPAELRLALNSERLG